MHRANQVRGSPFRWTWLAIDIAFASNSSWNDLISLLNTFIPFERRWAESSSELLELLAGTYCGWSLRLTSVIIVTEILHPQHTSERSAMYWTVQQYRAKLFREVTFTPRRRRYPPDKFILAAYPICRHWYPISPPTSFPSTRLGLALREVNFLNPDLVGYSEDLLQRKLSNTRVVPRSYWIEVVPREA